MIRYFVDITGAGEHRPHTSILFEYKGSTYLADPFFSRKGRPFLHKVSAELLAHYKELEKKNQFQEIEPGKVSFDRLSHERETGVLG
jgi:hypothetical protein